MHIGLLLLLLALQAGDAYRVRDAKLDKSIHLEALKQVCANKRGGKLNRELVVANYELPHAAFEDSQELAALVLGSRHKFSDEHLSLVKHKRSYLRAPDKLVERHQKRLCDMLTIITKAIELARASKKAANELEGETRGRQSGSDD